MYKTVNDTDQGPADFAGFLETLNDCQSGRLAGIESFFDFEAPVIVTRAPGRLDVMGGIADYSGSLVLQMPTREAAYVAIQAQSSPTVTAVSLQGPDRPPLKLGIALEEFLEGGQPITYDKAHTIFHVRPTDAWAAYVVGAFIVLMRETGARFPTGARILIDSAVPQGRGVSSSAALEVATMSAIVGLFGLDVQPQPMALLCQKVENCVAGAPCGLMDQMTAVCGSEGRLLALVCQPAQLQPPVAIPDGVEFWGLDSGIAHAVSGSDYSSVRVGAFMGHRIIAERDGERTRPLERVGQIEIDDGRWGGYLARISPSRLETTYSAALPERISGADFIARFQGTADPVTRIDPNRTYAVRTPASHPIYENFRTNAFRELLTGAPSESALSLLGELMFQSHASYSACGLGSAGTDLLAELARKAGPASGVYGARISGGGCGGTVVVLTRAGARQSIMEMAGAYAKESGHQPYLFSGSSSGAALFGHQILNWIS